MERTLSVCGKLVIYIVCKLVIDKGVTTHTISVDLGFVLLIYLFGSWAEYQYEVVYNKYMSLLTNDCFMLAEYYISITF